MHNIDAVIKRTIIRDGLSDTRIHIAATTRTTTSILDLPFETVWYIPLLMCTYIYCCLELMELAHIFNLSYGRNIFNAIYLVDIVLVAMYKYFHESFSTIVPTIRPYKLLLIELIATIPFYELYSNKNSFIYDSLGALQTLKMIRIIYHFHLRHGQISIGLFHRLVILAISVLFTSFVALTFIYQVYKNFGTDPSKQEWFDLFVIFEKLSTWGFTAAKTDFVFELIMTVCILIDVYFIKAVLLSRVGNDFIMLNRHRYFFKLMVNHALAEIRLLNAPKLLYKSVIKHFTDSWLYLQGYNLTVNNILFVPQGLQTEILLDIHCMAFKHSRIFREADVRLVRLLSRFCTKKIYQTDEYIFERGEMKSKMIYVVSGIVQIISEEDGETPIMSLSSGTCLGESTLFVPHKSGSTLRCKGCTEIQELHINNFSKLAILLPETYRKMHREIIERYEETKRIKTISNYFNKNDVTQDCTISWIKYILRILLSLEKDQGINLYLSTEVKPETKDTKMFTTKYLDMLVLSTGVELNEVAEFFTTKFPLIVNPRSFLLMLWNTWICILIVTCLILLPKYVFYIEADIPVKIMITFRIINYSFFLDLLIRMFTAIKTAEAILLTVKSITRYRAKTFTFFCDIIAALPLELFICISVKQDIGYSIIILRLNKLFKVWRIWILFNRIQQKYNINLLLTFSIMFLFVILYLVYCWSHIFYYVNCNFSPYNCHYNDDYKTFFSAAQLVTGIGLRSSIDKIYHTGIMTITCYISSCLIVVILLMYIVSSYILQNTTYLMMETLKIELINVIELYKINKTLVRRLMRYVDTQLSFDNGATLIRNEVATRRILSEEFNLIMEKEFSKHIKQLKFFSDLPAPVLLKICSLFNYTLLPPHEVVCYEGDKIMDVMYILTKGICEFKSKYNQRESRGCEIINPMVCTHNTPIIHTCVTKTCCLILSINYLKMLDIIEKHYMYMFNLKALAMEALSPLNLLELDTSSSTYVEPEGIYAIKTFVTFGKGCQSTYHTSEFYRVFPKTCLSKLIQCLLMRFTIQPNSTFMYLWEMSRSFFALLTNISNGLLIVVISQNVFVKMFLYFLDIVAFVDIYVKLHFCYYNQEGLLISHPYFTAKHYLQHNFVVDLLAALPWSTILFVHKPWKIIILNSNRLLQLYRYYGFLSYNEQKVANNKDKFYVCWLLPPLILSSIYLGSLAIAMDCVFGKDVNVDPQNFERDVYCDENSWISDSTFTKPLSSLRVQLYGIYLVSSILSNAGIQGFSLESFSDGLFCTVMSILGILYLLIISARVTLHHTRGSYDLALYQATLNNLKGYMIIKKVDKFIQRFTIKYYEFKWRRERGRNLCELLNATHYTLKEDILYNIYGESMMKYSVFSSGTQQFIKCILSNAIHECLLINCNILRVNDICSKIYIIYKGFVSIYLPEGTKLDVIGPGGVFGNLDMKRFNRIKVKVVTMTHLEVLHMDTLVFYKIIKRWPLLLKEFVQMKAVYMYYLPTKNIDTKAMEKSLEKGKQTFKYKKSRKWLINVWRTINTKVFDPNSVVINIWSILNLITCYFALFLYVTQVTFSSFGIGFVLLQYICDTIYFVYNFYFVHHLSYENDKGIIINDIRLIRKKNAKNYKGLLSSLMHLPYDIILFAVPNKTLRFTLFKILRMNRLLRYRDIYQSYKNHNDRVSLNIYITEMLYMGTTTFLLFHTLTCSIIFVSTFFELNMTIYIPSNLQELSKMDKVHLYITYFYMVTTSISKVGIDSHAPDGPELILYTIAFIFLCPFIHTEIYAKDFMLIFKKTFLRKIFYDKVNSLQFYFNKQEVSGQIVSKTFRYLNLLWIKYTGTLRPYLLTVAPKYLQEYINCASYSFNINNHVIFSKCHIDFRRQLCNFVDYDLYLPGDYITYKQTLDSTMYIIRKGEIEVLDEDENWNETSVDILSGYNSFGLKQGLYPNVPQTHSYRAIRFSVVLFLKYERWAHLLNYFPASKEIIYKCLNELEI